MSTPPDLDALLTDYRRETTTLRMGVQLPGPHAAPETILDCLLDVRKRLDRVEALLGYTMQLRAEAHRTHTAVRIVADDAWDEAAVRLRSMGVRDEFSSAKERTAATNLEVISERRVERKAAEAARSCDEAVDYIRLRHRGLADVRMDLLSAIRSQQFETTLDR